MPTPSLMAQGDVRPSRFVKIDPDNDRGALESDANERVIGISMEGSREAPIPSVTTALAAQDGEQMHFYGQGEICLLELGGTVSSNDRLKSDADGKGVVIATTGTTIQHFGAVALRDGVSGDKIEVQVLIGSERPALA